jgi:3-phenylpropionate/trans-cinnamate dioxygenase ferredoxin reductase subunit
MPEVRVEAVHVSQREVQIAGRDSIHYDAQLLATGGRNRRLTLPGADLPGIYQLRTLAECDAIKAAAQPGARAVVVGLGFIGAEVTASLISLGVKVTALSTGDGPLSVVLGEQVASVMARIHQEKVVELLLGELETGFVGDGYVEGVVTRRGRRLPCDFAVVAIGIQPNAELASAAAITVDNGILADGYLRTSADAVFAAGDVANHLHPLFGRVRVEHYNNAEKMGRAVARNMLGRLEPYEYLCSFWSDQYDDKSEYVGYARKWDEFVVRGSREARRFLGFYFNGGRLLAAMGLNRGGIPSLTKMARWPRPAG